MVVLHSLVEIAVNTLAVFVHQAEVVEGHGQSLFCRALVPADRFFIVDRNAVAFVIHQSNSVLSIGMALISGELEVIERLLKIGFNTVAFSKL